MSGTVTISVLIVPEAGSWSLFLIGLAPLALIRLIGDQRRDPVAEKRVVVY